MNDRMSDMDALKLSDNEALIQRLAHLSPFYAQDSQLAVDYVRAILGTVGLPALLERVEAAEGERKDWRVRETKYRETHVPRAERDALAAKVARVEALADKWQRMVYDTRNPRGDTGSVRRCAEEVRAELTEGTEG